MQTTEQYENRKALRIARLERLIEATRRESARTYEATKARAEVIPFGQPIIMGRGSRTTRDMNYRTKIQDGYRKAYNLQDLADRYQSKLEAAKANNSIQSDNPDALSLLKNKLTNLEAKQTLMVTVNKFVRKGDQAGLALHFAVPFDNVSHYFVADRYGNKGFESWQLTNNNATIRQVKARIAELERMATRSDVEFTIGDIRIVEDTDDVRIRLHFPGKPDRDTIQQLKRNGFRWSPTNEAWQRQLNGNGQYAVQYLLKAIGAVSEDWSYRQGLQSARKEAITPQSS